MRFIKYIIYHCTAGHSDARAVQDYFLRPVNKGGRGWRIGGYHIFVDYDGSLEQLYPFEQITNGVAGFNKHAIHIVYRGGVLKENVRIAADTRTPEQKEGLLLAAKNTLEFLKNYQDIKHIKLRGHRDFSPDQNNNGIIEPWERIKECPSFEVQDEYWWVQGREALISNKLL